MRFGLWRALPFVLAAASPASAFDCKKASTASEKAICADPAARAADETMAQAFSKLIGEASPASKASILAAQTEWISVRDGACSEQKGAQLGACLAQESARRRAFLAGEPEAGPGAPGRLAPWFRHEKGGKGKAAISLQLLRYAAPATPAERAFDNAVDKLGDAIEQPEKDAPGDDHYEYDRTMRLTYASPRLISALLEGYSNSGGAHPNTYTGNINIDVEGGREAAFADLLDAKAAKTIFAYCLKSVVAEKKDKMGADAPLGADDMKELTKNVAESTAKLDTWSFGPDTATVTYDAYAVGAYVEGAYLCEIPYATLKPLAKPSFPLP